MNQIKLIVWGWPKIPQQASIEEWEFEPGTPMSQSHTGIPMSYGAVINVRSYTKYMGVLETAPVEFMPVTTLLKNIALLLGEKRWQHENRAESSLINVLLILLLMETVQIIHKKRVQGSNLLLSVYIILMAVRIRCSQNFKMWKCTWFFFVVTSQGRTTFSSLVFFISFSPPSGEASSTFLILSMFSWKH